MVATGCAQMAFKRTSSHLCPRTRCRTFADGPSKSDDRDRRRPRRCRPHTGLFTGLLISIVGVFQAMLSALDGSRFTTVMAAQCDC
jgi:hypothetical protein